jgi:hypothetical protein
LPMRKLARKPLKSGTVTPDAITSPTASGTRLPPGLHSSSQNCCVKQAEKRVSSTLARSMQQRRRIPSGALRGCIQRTMGSPATERLLQDDCGVHVHLGNFGIRSVELQAHLRCSHGRKRSGLAHYEHRSKNGSCALLVNLS